MTDEFKLYGRMVDGKLTVYAHEAWIAESAIVKGHVIKVANNLLLCTGHRDEMMRQPNFENITNRVQK